MLKRNSVFISHSETELCFGKIESLLAQHGGFEKAILDLQTALRYDHAGIGKSGPVRVDGRGSVRILPIEKLASGKDI
jgi:hypothetical protein